MPVNNFVDLADQNRSGEGLFQQRRVPMIVVFKRLIGMAASNIENADSAAELSHLLA